MALLNEQQSQLLTFPGFATTFENRWLHDGFTQREAFGIVVREVKTIITQPLYDDSEFEEFIDRYKKRRKRLSQHK